jgi:hypothetical protein
MYRLSVMVLVLALGGLFFVNATAVHADSGPDYDINGTMTLTGNSDCGGTCIETISYSFELSSPQNPSSPSTQICAFEMYSGCVIGPISSSSTGPIASFDLIGLNGQPFPDRGLFLAFTDGRSDEADMYFQPAGTGTPPLALESNLFECESAACVNDGFNGSLGAGDVMYTFTVANEFTATLVPTPEPPTAMLGLCGILALCLLAPRRKLQA